MNIPKKQLKHSSRTSQLFDKMLGSGDMRKVKRYMNRFMHEYRRQKKLINPGTKTTQRVLKFEALMKVFRPVAFANM